MSDTIDQQFVEYIAKTLVDNADAVEVERTIDERGVLLQLHVAPEDLGRVIGRAGSTAKSIRTLLRALSVKNDARYNLKIVDSGDPAQAVSDDDVKPEGKVEESDTEEVAEEAVVESETPEETPVEPDHSEESDAENDVVSRNRKELADLTDDLEV